MTMSDQDWTWWENALRGKREPIDVNRPESGFYRTSYGDFTVPVAYWHQNGTLRCHRNGHEINGVSALELWPFASKTPVSREAYDERIATGKWPNENEAVRKHNAAPPDDSIEAIFERIDDLAREARKMLAAGPALDTASCDQAADLANTFGELEDKAHDLRTKEKRPHLEAGKDVDKKWSPAITMAGNFKTSLKNAVIAPFLAKQKERGIPRITAGSSKRSVSLHTRYHAVIDDQDKLLNALRGHPDVLKVLQTIADRAANDKIALPGCHIIAEHQAV